MSENKAGAGKEGKTFSWAVEAMSSISILFTRQRRLLVTPAVLEGLVMRCCVVAPQRGEDPVRKLEQLCRLVELDDLSLIQD
jgi:hypothetical protein